MMYPISVPKIIQSVIDDVRTDMLETLQAYDETIQTIGFMYGNIREIVNNLAEMSNNSVEKAKKFPLFILLEDIAVDRRNTNYYGIAEVNIIICNHTEREYKSSEREEINFENILRPLYQSFLSNLSDSPYIVEPTESSFKHVYTERKFWGADNNTANKLGDYIDAIDITNLKLTISDANCDNLINDY